MKFTYPNIDIVFDTSIEKVNTLVIENPRLMVELLSEISSQLRDFDGKCVLSDQDKEIPLSKGLELLTYFTPFEINTKALVSKLATALEKRAVAEYYGESEQLLGEIERFFFKVSQDFSCAVDFSKISMNSLTKSLGAEFCDDYESLCEKLCDYFELVQEFERQKLFVTLNLRAFISDEEFEKFLDTVILHEYNLIMIENKEYPRSNNESRYIIDSELCEIH